MMHPRVSAALADAHARELRRAGGTRSTRRRRSGLREAAPLRRLRFVLRVPHRRDVAVLPGPLVPDVRIRWAFADDSAALVRLAARTGACAPRAPVLLAEVDGRVGAALSLCDGNAISSPADLGEQALDLLTVRASQLGPASQATAPRWRVSA